jgi:uncharacterized protein YegL
VSQLPGGELKTRPLHFIWICDCSGTMSVNGKIEALNNAIKESIPEMQRVADENANAQVLVRAVKFSNSAQWHIATPTPVDSFRWEDLSADGLTDMGRALSLVAEQLKMPPMTDRALPPVLVLISDGQPTDDFRSGVKALMEQPWGKKAVRIAIAIGGDAELDPLQEFIGNPEMKPLQANNAETLVKYIRWASTAVLKSASAPSSQPSGSSTSKVGTVPIPAAPTASTTSSTDDDVW